MTDTRAVLSLFGGILGFSLVFFRFVIGSNGFARICLLVVAWCSLAFGIVSAVYSFKFNASAHRKAGGQYDKRKTVSGEEDGNGDKHLGGIASWRTGLEFFLPFPYAYPTYQ